MPTYDARKCICCVLRSLCYVYSTALAFLTGCAATTAVVIVVVAAAVAHRTPYSMTCYAMLYSFDRL